MAKRKPSTPPPGYIGYFTLCQVIGGELHEAGRRIEKFGIHAPVLHKFIIDELESKKLFCEQAIKAVNEAQKMFSENRTV